MYYHAIIEIDYIGLHRLALQGHFLEKRTSPESLGLRFFHLGRPKLLEFCLPPPHLLVMFITASVTFDSEPLANQSCMVTVEIQLGYTGLNLLTYENIVSQVVLSKALLKG